MAGVEDQHRGFILRMIRGAGGFVSQQGGLHVGRQVGAQAVGFFDPERHRGRGVGDRQAAQAGGLAHGVFGAEHAAPGLAEQVVAAGDAEMGKQGIEFGEEQIHRPERRIGVGQMGGAAAAELVVMDDGAFGGGEAGEAQSVVMQRARPAMQHDQRRQGGIAAAGDPEPGCMAAEGQGAAACDGLMGRR